MIFLSAQRIVTLLRVHWRLLVLCACLSSFASFMFGSLTPYLFRSEAMLMLPVPKTIDPMASLDNTDVLRVANLFKSPKVLAPVAEAQLKRYGAKANFLILNSWSWFDFTQRWNIFKSKMIYSSKENSEAPDLGNYSVDTFVSLIAKEIVAEADPSMRTIRVVYDAGVPEYAQATTQLLIDEFIRVLAEMEQQELQRQEKYLLGAIDQQLQSIRETEESMRLIVEKHPELSVAGGTGGGAGTLAQKFLERQEVLKKLEGEFDANRKFLDSIQGDLSQMSQNRGVASKVSPELSTKLAEEIGELEFKKMQYLQVSGYEEDHPEIQKIVLRIQTLKNLLGSSNGAGNGQGTYKSLFQKRAQINERNKSLDVEKETVSGEMHREQNKFRELVKRNFDLDSLMRNLNVNVTITGELYRELQKARLNMAGAQGKASVLMAPSLSVHASNISVKKRTFFGFVIGIGIAISLLLLFDLFSPILLHEDDFVCFGEKVFGPFRGTERGKHQLFSWFSAMRMEKAKRNGGISVRLTVGLLGQSDHRRAWEPFIHSSLREMTAKGEKIGIVVVRDPEGWEERFDWGLSESAVEELIIDDVPNTLGSKVAEMQKRFEYVFVIMNENRSGIPVETYLEEHTDLTLIVSQLGISSLKTVRKLSLMMPDVLKKGHLVLAPYHVANRNPFSKLISDRLFPKKAA